jgi:2-oxoisovalerate dehydrogenase E1 component
MPNKIKNKIPTAILEKAFRLMTTAKTMTEIYEENFKMVSKYVHATSRGHEAIQIAMGMLLQPQDYVAPYYRDDAMLLSIGMRPYDLMLQIFAKKDDPFSGGRAYYAHPSLKDADKPKIPHQSSATGMQTIPMTGVAMGLQYREKRGLDNFEEKPIAVCSLGDASVTEGEIAEAFQMAILKKLPILYLVQDNGWDISANAAETRVANAAEYAKGFPGLEAISIEGNDFENCYQTLQKVIETMRKERRPFLVHARVPLLNHHTSGVRKEWYRDDLEEHQTRDPYPILEKTLLKNKFSAEAITAIQQAVRQTVVHDFQAAYAK